MRVALRRKFVLQGLAVGFSVFSSGALASDLRDQLAKVCDEQNATPVDISLEEEPAYCLCEANNWVKRGTETQIRSTMVFMTGDLSYLQGQAYDYDATLDFIVAHTAESEASCTPD